MHTSCNSPTREGSYASKLSQDSSVTIGNSEPDGYNPSTTTRSSFKNPSKVSKPRRRPPKTHLKILGPVSSHTTPAAHQAAISASPFLSLPGEIRNMIYVYALTSETNRLSYDKQLGRFDVSKIGAGLIQTCHMVSCETMYMPLTLNTIVFPTSTGSGEAELKRLGCMGKIMRLGYAFNWHGSLKFELIWSDKLTTTLNPLR